MQTIERFVQRAVVDTQQGGMTAVTIHVPESWHFESKIEWNYAWVAYPVNPSWHAENPANAEAYFQYESWQLVDIYVAPRWRQYVKQPKLGDRYPLGQIHMVLVPPLQAMTAFIKSVRGDVANLKWLGQQDLPDLAKTLRLPPSPNQHGVAIKIGYDLNGKPVEEAFFGVYFMNKAGAPAVQAGHQAMGANEIIETNWGLQGLQSFRAPAGTLDKRMPVYCVIAKSVQADPKWLARVAAINATFDADVQSEAPAGLGSDSCSGCAHRRDDEAAGAIPLVVRKRPCALAADRWTVFCGRTVRAVAVAAVAPPATM